MTSGKGSSGSSGSSGSGKFGASVSCGNGKFAGRGDAATVGGMGAVAGSLVALVAMIVVVAVMAAVVGRLVVFHKSMCLERPENGSLTLTPLFVVFGFVLVLVIFAVAVDFAVVASGGI